MKIKDKNEDIGNSNIENQEFDKILALNIGNFVVEQFMSKELIKKIGSSIDIKVKLKNQLNELFSIYSLDNTLNLLGFDTDDNYIIFDSIAKTLANILQVDACHIFMEPEFINRYDEDGLYLLGSSITQKPKDFKYSQINNNFEFQSYNTGQLVYCKNSSSLTNWNRLPLLDENKVITYIASPMMDKQSSVGMIVLQCYQEADIPQETIELLQSTANLFVISMRLQEVLEETSYIIEDDNATEVEMTHLRAKLTEIIGDLGVEQKKFVESLACASDAKSDYTKEHSKKVAHTAKLIAQQLDLNEKTLDLVYYAGLLKNIGKITLSNTILEKKNLSFDEWEKLQNHPNIGVDLLMKVNFLSEVVPYVHYHAERWDGKGKPEGLEGRCIPLGSRIIAVADAYEALIEDRAYRKSISQHDALKTMESEAGVKWDPAVVHALIKAV